MTDYDLWCVLGGRGGVKIHNQRFPTGPGTCWVFSPGSRPEAVHDQERPLTVLAMHLEFPDGEGCTLRLDEQFPTDRPIQLPNVRRLQLLAEFLVGTDAEGSDCQLAVWQLIHLLSHPEGQPGDRVDPRLQRVLRRVMEQLSHPWSVPEMAGIAGLSASRFSALFRENLQQSPRQYVIAARMNRASTLLLESELSQAEIADMLGFQDVYFFNRQFSTHHGISPGRYRRRSRA